MNRKLKVDKRIKKVQIDDFSFLVERTSVGLELTIEGSSKEDFCMYIAEDLSYNITGTKSFIGFDCSQISGSYLFSIFESKRQPKKEDLL